VSVAERGTSDPRGGREAALEAQVRNAQEGDATALEDVVRAIQSDVYGLALRFLWHPQDAEDATQDILIRVLTRLGSFRGESTFRTWVYRVASNALISMKKGRAEGAELTVDEFSEDLAQGLSDDEGQGGGQVDRALLLEEVRVGCTTAMLLCLDRPHRLAYVLGEIFGLDHQQASDVLEISPANFRQRLSRARAQITGLMSRSCGLFDPSNACRCRRRLKSAVELGRVDPERLLFASSREKARLFPEVLAEIRNLQEVDRAVALYRSNSEPDSTLDVATWLRDLLKRGEEFVGRWATWN